MKKITFILAFLILLLVSVSIVTADNNDSDIISSDDSQDDQISQADDLDKVSTDDDKDKVSSSDDKDKLKDEQGFSVKKVWNDNNDSKNKRPDSIKFKIKLNGNYWGDEKELNKSQDWKTTIQSKFSANDEIEIVEVEVPGYTSKVSGNPETGFTITNTLDDQDNETSTDGSDDSSDDGSSDDSSDKDSQITTKITTKTTTKTTTTKNPDKKQPDKKKDNNKTGNPVLLGVLAISVAGLAYQLRRKE